MSTAKDVSRNPWLWIPTLYLAEGLPNVLVASVSVVFYKNLGVSNAAIAFYTGWLYLPWVIKPLWSPVVDLLKNAAAMDLGDAISPRRGTGGRGADDSRAALFPADARVFLAAGVQFGDARHRGGRFLHAGDDGTRAVVFRRHPQHVLSRGDNWRTGRPGDSCRENFPAHRGLFICVVNRLRTGRGNLSVLWFLSLVHFAASGQRPIQDFRAEKFPRGIFQNFRNIFSEAKNRRAAFVSAALPARRGATRENGRSRFCSTRARRADWV